MALAEAIRAGLSRLEPDAKIFFSPVSLGSGLWVPKLADEIAAAEAFLLLIGPQGIGPWQKVEYFTAFDRHVNEKAFALVPVIAAGAQAPGLSFLRSLNWVEAPVVTEDKALHQMLAALKARAAATATPLWKLVLPYRGLEAMTEANADYFFGRTTETSGVLNTLAGKPDHLPILIGASGVGKSSVALAGVLSALKAMRWPSNDGAGSAPWPAALQRQGQREGLAEGLDVGTAALEAGCTTLSTRPDCACHDQGHDSNGFLPLAKVASRTLRLGAVIGGLTVATVATLFFVPTVISVLCRPHKGKVPYKVRHL